MEDERTTCLQHDEDDALSLTDFPLDHHSSPPPTRRSSSEPPDFFQFLKDDDVINTSICSADDVIVSGKLVPFKGQCNNPTRKQEETKLPLRSRSDSSSVQKAKPAVKLTRSSRSVDGTSSYVRGSIGKPESSEHPRTTRPRWYVFMMMFGVAKFPTEMELRDIRTRQLRRTATSTSVVEKFPASRSGSWKLLKALSCKDHASVAVATSSFDFISNHYSY